MEEPIVSNPLLAFFGEVAWPVAILIIVFVFRRDLSALIGRIQSLKYPGGELSLQPEDPEAQASRKTSPHERSILDDDGFYNRAGLRDLLQNSGLTKEDEEVVGEILIFQPIAQRTWIVATNRQLFCILDDVRTRAKGSSIQWHLALDKATPIRARVSPRGNPVVDIGSKTGWLYSPRLFPDEASLEEEISELIAEARK